MTPKDKKIACNDKTNCQNGNTVLRTKAAEIKTIIEIAAMKSDLWTVFTVS